MKCNWMNTWYHAIVVLVIAICCFPNCFAQELKEAELIWRSYNATEYEYTYEYDINGPVRITVRDNVVVIGVYIEDGTVVGSNVDLPTIEGLYDLIENNIDIYSVQYEFQFQYPALITNTETGIVIKVSDIFFLQRPPMLQAQRELDTAMALWRSQSISNYDFQYDLQCFCLPEVTALKDVTVLNNVVSSVTYAIPDSSLSPNVPQNVPTIPEIFDRIQAGINQNAYSIVVMYDGSDGHPTDIFIDYNRVIADEEYIAKIPSFDRAMDLQEEQRALDAARALWESQNILSYDFQFMLSCNCLPEYVATRDIAVRVNEINSVTYADPDAFPGLPANVPQQIVDQTPTIPAIFDRIQNGIDRNAHEVRVEYDRQFGYPTSVYIDYDEFIADEEYIANIPILRIIAFDDTVVRDIIAFSAWSSQYFTQRVRSLLRRRSVIRGAPLVSLF